MKNVVDDDGNEKATYFDDHNFSSGKISLKKHTESLDTLYIQNKNLQKELDEEMARSDYFEAKLKDSNIRISKNLFFIGLIVITYMIYLGIGSITKINNKLIEMTAIVREYKDTIEKTKLYNQIILEKDLKIKNKGE